MVFSIFDSVAYMTTGILSNWFDPVSLFNTQNLLSIVVLAVKIIDCLVVGGPGSPLIQTVCSGSVIFMQGLAFSTVYVVLDKIVSPELTFVSLQICI